MNPAPAPVLVPVSRARPPLWQNSATGLVAGIGVSAISYGTAGPGLGYFFGTFLLISIVFPYLIPMSDPAVRADDRVRSTLLVCGATGMGVGVAWCILFRTPGVVVTDVLRCLVVLLAYLAALAGVVLLLCRLHIPPILAAAATVVIAFAWLTWPVWLSPALSGPHGESIVGLLVHADPLMAANSVLKVFGAWDHAYSIAYNQLTTLNQDAPYRMPGSIFPSVLVHCVIAVAAMAGSALPTARTSTAGQAHPMGRDRDRRGALWE